MKQALAILLFIAVLLQSFSKLVVYADYYVHKDYIAKNLCENRNKPMMHCNGKCHLKKQLAKQEKEEQSPNSKEQKEKQEVVLFCWDNSEVFTAPQVQATTTKYFNRNTILTSSFSGSVFHPPSVAA